MRALFAFAVVLAAAACGSSPANMSGPCAGVTCSGHGLCSANGAMASCSCDAGYRAQGTSCVSLTGPCASVTCSGHGTCDDASGSAVCTCAGGYVASTSTTCVESMSPTIAGCPILPANHIFNTPIDTLPVHPNSAAFLTKINTNSQGVFTDRKLHLDLGQSVDMTSNEYYGIPYNVVRGNSLTWKTVRYRSADPDLDWDPTTESDCAAPMTHAVISPCTASAAPTPQLPIPDNVRVEGGIDTDPSQPYGDHHILLLDADNCRLWETYHSYPNNQSSWDIFGSATFDLRSNALRPADWTSADAAGFPILPLLLRADEASSGAIRHALRFTVDSNDIRRAYVWPARHLTNKGTTSMNEPPMGQLFRLKASYQIPANFNPQAKAILQAMKTYGMYIADGGSDWYVQGEPSADWLDGTFDQVQSVASSNFEAVDLTPIMSRPGFNPDSAAVP